MATGLWPKFPQPFPAFGLVRTRSEPDRAGVRTLSGHSNAVNAARFSSSGLYATGNTEGMAQLGGSSHGSYDSSLHLYWLVVWNIFYFPIFWE